MAELRLLESATRAGQVYVNPEHVTHIAQYELSDGKFDASTSVVWLVNGKGIAVKGSISDVEIKLFPDLA